MKKKIILSLLFLILMAAGLVRPLGAVVSAAGEDAGGAGFTVEAVDAGMITVSSEKLDRIYADVQIGNKKAVTEMYKLKDQKANIDISFIKGKEATVKVYSRGKKDAAVTVKVSAQPKGLKGKFNAKTGEMTVTLAGGSVENSKVNCRIGRKTAPISSFNFENYYVKGATAYIYILQTGDYKAEEGKSETSFNVTPASKEIKVKIPAREKGPLAVIDPDLISLGVQKGWVIQLTHGDKTVSETAAQQKKINLVTFASQAGINIASPLDSDERKASSNAAVIEVYKAATEKKLESKTTEVIVPWQPFLDENLLSSTSGISYTPLYNAAKTKQTGIKINNKTSEIFHVAILDKDRDVSDINLLETDNSKKLVWYEVKPNRVRSITGDKIVSGAQVVYRIRGTIGKGDKKTKLASTILADPERIKVMESARNESSIIEVSSIKPTAAETLTTSATALTVKNYSGAVSYAYVVLEKSIIGVKLGTKQADLQKSYSGLKAATADEQVQVGLSKQNLWIVAFAMDNDGNVIAYSSKQITKSDMY